MLPGHCVILRCLRGVLHLVASLLVDSTWQTFIHTYHVPDTTPGRGISSCIPQASTQGAEGPAWEAPEHSGTWPRDGLFCPWPGEIQAGAASELRL